jgi:hypothetical protein
MLNDPRLPAVGDGDGQRTTARPGGKKEVV